jgi:putative endonuclease
MRDSVPSRNVSGDRRSSLGARGEQLAREHLSALGFRIVDANWRCREGEIDIIAWDDQVMSFIEVRTRRGSRGPLPEQSLSRAKQERLVRLGRLYLDQNSLTDVQWRIDLVAVEMDRRGVLVRVELITNAVSGW